MPLVKSGSDKAFKKNLKTEMKNGKPQKQALAIAYGMKRKNMSKGGKCPDCTDIGGLCAVHDDQGQSKIDSKKDMYADGGPVNGTDGSQYTYGDDGKPGDHPVYGNPDRQRDGYPPQDGRYGKTFGKASRSTDGYDGAPGGYARSLKDSEKDRYGEGGDPQRNYAMGGKVKQPGKLDKKPVMDVADNDQDEAKRNSAYARYAEGGMVDDQAPLRDHAANDDDSEERHPERDEHDYMPLEMPVDEMDSELEQDLPGGSVNMSLAQEIMKDRKRRMFAKGGSVDQDVSYKSMGVGQVTGTTDPTTDSDETNDADEKEVPVEDGRDTRGLDLEYAHTMTDPEHDTSDASLVAQILKDRKNRRRG